MPQEIALDALDLAAIIRPGDHIVWGQGAGEPSTLVEKLLEQRHSIGHASIFLGGVRSRRTLRPEHADVLTFSSIGAIGNLRALANAGVLRVIPTHLSQLPGYQGVIGADVVFVQLSEPDEHGEYSFSIANDFQQAAMARARVVIAEVNDKIPWTYCEGRIDPARLSTNRPVPRGHPCRFAGRLSDRPKRRSRDTLGVSSMMARRSKSASKRFPTRYSPASVTGVTSACIPDSSATVWPI